MKIKIFLKVNGKDEKLEVNPNKTLYDVLREELHLTGTKEGCGKGECGACTVIMDGKAVTSCLILASSVNGHELITIEGITPHNGLHPIQQAFVDNGAIQCGFCTLGFIMSAKALLDKNPKPSRDEIKEAIAGNLCRCTGYKKIIEAIESVSGK